MRNALIVAALLALAGCDTVWYRDNTTEQQFYQDEYECQNAALGGGGISGYGTIVGSTAVGGLNRNANRRLYNACMRGKGYVTER